MLIGIMAKNGIHVVEFADQLRDRGLAVRDAVETAARHRARPEPSPRFGDVIRNAVSLGRDADTLAAIAGPIADTLTRSEGKSPFARLHGTGTFMLAERY